MSQDPPPPKVSPLDLEHLPFPAFTEPRRVGFFSISNERQCIPDSRVNLKRLALERLPSTLQETKEFRCFGDSWPVQGAKLDLNVGFERFHDRQHAEGKPEYLNTFLEWILARKGSEAGAEQGEPSAKKQKITMSIKQACSNADFVSWRGLLTKIAATPYENRDGWAFLARRIGEVTFLCEVETTERREARLKANERERRMSFWGYKFEEYMTAPPPPPGEVVNCNEQFCLVVFTKLSGKRGAHRLFFAGEVDCFEDEKAEFSEKSEFVELKTSRVIEDARQEKNFVRFKLVKWWLQSFLIGIRRVLIGFRDDTGHVRRICSLDVHEMTKLASGATPAWKGNACFNFLDDVLQFVRAKLDGAGGVWRFEWARGMQTVGVRELAKDEEGKEFLPGWFVGKFDVGVPAGV